jgi:hypothetical protein
VRVFSTVCVLPRSPNLCFSICETEKSDKGKSQVGGDYSQVVFGQKFPGEKGSVRQCIAMMLQPVILSPKFGVKSSHIFTQWP